MVLLGFGFGFDNLLEMEFGSGHRMAWHGRVGWKFGGMDGWYDRWKDKWISINE